MTAPIPPERPDRGQEGSRGKEKRIRDTVVERTPVPTTNPAASSSSVSMASRKITPLLPEITRLEDVVFRRVNDANIFYEAIKQAKECGIEEELRDGTYQTLESNHFGAYVKLYPLNQYENPEKFLIQNNKAGFALLEKDIISVFKHPALEIRGIIRKLMPHAVAAGGRRLDCFNGFLPIIYSAFGFIPIAKVKFDRSEAPHNWNYARDGEPDIIFMVYDKAFTEEHGHKPSDEREKIISNMIENLGMHVPYDEACARQSAAVLER